MQTRPLRVFVSSTARDLAEYRLTAQRVVRQLEWEPVLLMEDEAVFGGRIVDECLRLVESCDVFVSIIGNRHGWVPEPSQGGDGVHSITALELAFWLRRTQMDAASPPPLVFMLRDNRPCHATANATAQSLAQERFRKTVASGLIVHEFEAPGVGDSGHEAAIASFESRLRNQLGKLRVRIADQVAMHATVAAWSAKQAARKEATKALLTGGALGALAAVIITGLSNADE